MHLLALSRNQIITCCRHIAENEQALDHYQKASASITSAIENGQVKVESNKLVGSTSKSEFIYQQAFDLSKSIWNDGKFASAATRADFVAKLNAAISEQ